MSHIGSLPFPSLKAYADLVRAFQKTFWPQLGRFWSSGQPVSPAPGFRFATAISEKTPLSVAVVDCVDQVQRKLGLGVQPDFCQLHVTPDPHCAHLKYAPQYVQEIFSSYGLKPPVLIGGAVEALIGDYHGPSWYTDSEDENTDSKDKAPLLSGKGVSLMAAVLPGTQMHPFHTATSSLPNIAWSDLLHNPESQGQKSNAAILLSEHKFEEAKEFADRLTNTLPEMPIFGGVVGRAAEAYSDSKARPTGSLFLNDQTFHAGAVGCILSGDLKVDTFCIQGCRPVGPEYRVTRVTNGSTGTRIKELDGRNSREVVAEANRESSELRGKWGMDVTGSGDGYRVPVLGTYAFDDKRSIGVNHHVPTGSLMQMHVRDDEWGQVQLYQKLRQWLGSIPEGDESDVCMLVFSNWQVNHDVEGEIGEVLEDFPSLTVQGCKTVGEIMYAPPSNNKCWQDGLNTRLTVVNDFRTSIGVLRYDPK